MRTHLIFLFGVLVIGCFVFCDEVKAQSPAKESKHVFQEQVAGFWHWFVSNKSQFVDLETNREKLVPEIVDHLREMSQNLTVEIEPPKSGIRRMAVSADGMLEDFPLVEKIVDAAPHIDGWQIVAFRQPGKSKGVVLDYPGLTLDSGKMWMAPIEDKDGFDLILYFDDYTESKRSLLISGSYVLLDNAIGEYHTAKGIRSLDFQKLPPSTDRKGILPFERLADVYKKYRAKHPLDH